MSEIAVWRRRGREKNESLGLHCAAAFPVYACLGGAFCEKCCKNRGFARCGESVWLCVRSAGNAWPVNLGNFFFFGQKKGLSRHFYGETSVLAYIFQ